MRVADDARRADRVIEAAVGMAVDPERGPIGGDQIRQVAHEGGVERIAGVAGGNAAGMRSVVRDDDGSVIRPGSGEVLEETAGGAMPLKGILRHEAPGAPAACRDETMVVHLSSGLAHRRARRAAKGVIRPERGADEPHATDLDRVVVEEMDAFVERSLTAPG